MVCYHWPGILTWTSWEKNNKGMAPVTVSTHFIHFLHQLISALPVLINTQTWAICCSYQYIYTTLSIFCQVGRLTPSGTKENSPKHKTMTTDYKRQEQHTGLSGCFWSITYSQLQDKDRWERLVLVADGCVWSEWRIAKVKEMQLQNNDIPQVPSIVGILNVMENSITHLLRGISTTTI